MISFKSVGISSTNFTTQQTSVAATPLPIGIITPLRFGKNNDGLLGMHYTVSETIKNNFRDLVMTNWGERVMLYDFGANIQPLVTEYELGKAAFDEAAMSRISNAVTKWMPFIELESFDSSFEPLTTQFGLGTVRIIINYSVPRIQLATTSLQVTFAVS